MADRTRELPAPEGQREDAGELVPARVVLDLQRFQDLVRSVPGLPPPALPQVAAEIIDLLIAMRAPGNDAAEAAAILKSLDLDVLKTLDDPQGRNAHHAAVETLLAMGFPHALGVSPEALDEAKLLAPESRRRARRLRNTFVGLAVGGVFAFGVGSAGVFSDGALFLKVVGAGAALVSMIGPLVLGGLGDDLDLNK